MPFPTANNNTTQLTMYERNCPVCDSSNAETLYSNPNYKYLDASDRVYRAPLHYVVCNNCAHIYKNPNIDPSQLKILYRNAIIEPYNCGGQESQRSMMHYESFDELTNNFFQNLKEPISVLEIGCGNGALLNKIQERYSDKIAYIKGIEPSAELGRQLPNVINFEFENIFFDELNLGQKYDLIIMDNVFEHFDFPFDELKRLKKIIDKSGYLYISIPNILIMFSGFVDMFAGHPSNYLIENFKLIIDKAGFSVEKSAYKYKWLNCLVRLKKESDVLSDLAFPATKQELTDKIKKHLEENNNLLKKFKDVINKEIELLSANGKKMLIFGAGDHTHALISHINFKNVIAGLVDSNPYYHGKIRMGYLVYSPAQLQELDFEKILLSSQSFEQDMKKNLIDIGVPQTKIISLYE